MIFYALRFGFIKSFILNAILHYEFNPIVDET